MIIIQRIVDIKSIFRNKKTYKRFEREDFQKEKFYMFKHKKIDEKSPSPPG